MKHEKLALTDSLQDVVAKMSDGNPGAISVMVQMLDPDPMDAFGLLLSMDDMGMRGPAVWIGYKDYCNQDMAAFKKAVKDRDPAMLDLIRKNGYAVSEYRHQYS